MAESAKDPNMAMYRRFFYLGDESKTYPESVTYPFKSDKIKSIFDTECDDDVIHEILRVHRDGHYLALEPMVYVLAVLAHSKNTLTKQLAFKAVLEVCVTANAMLSFSHFYNELAKPMKGWGRCHRKFLSKWYNDKDVKDLTQEMTRVKSCHKWTHKDVLCMSHIKAGSIGAAVLFKYAVQGFEIAKRDFSSEPEAESILKYLEAIYTLTHTEDNETAARLIETNDLCLEVVPSKLLKTSEVSLCLIPRVPIKILLTLIPQLCKNGLIKLNTPQYKFLLERLGSEETLNDASIDPLESFLAIRRWQFANRLLPGKSILRQDTPAIDEALQNLHLASFKSVVPTNKKYLIAVDIRPYMSQSACGACKCVTPSNVSEILLLALVKAELSNVTVLVFSPEELVQVDINNKMTISDVNEHLTKVMPGPVNLFSLPQWALTKKKPFDLFLVITDSFNGSINDGWTEAFKEYKDTLHLPNARYIVASLSERSISTVEDDPYILHIIGFNVKLLKIIQDFASGVF